MTIKRIVILEISDQDNVALEEISKILERHPDLKLIEMVVEPTLIFNAEVKSLFPL